MDWRDRFRAGLVHLGGPRAGESRDAASSSADRDGNDEAYAWDVPSGALRTGVRLRHRRPRRRDHARWRRRSSTTATRPAAEFGHLHRGPIRGQRGNRPDTGSPGLRGLSTIRVDAPKSSRRSPRSRTDRSCSLFAAVSVPDIWPAQARRPSISVAIVRRRLADRDRVSRWTGSSGGRSFDRLADGAEVARLDRSVPRAANGDRRRGRPPPGWLASTRQSGRRASHREMLDVDMPG